MKKSKKFIYLCAKHGVDPDNIPEIMTIEAAFKARGVDINKMPIVNDLPKRFQKWLTAGFKLAVIVEALNADENSKVWIPNYNDSNERKYEIWFSVKADKKVVSGFGLSYDDFDLWATFSFVPARLCFKSRDLAEYAGKQFTNLFTDFQLFKE